MATLSEHADNIKAAIKAAIDDGFKLEVDLTYDTYNDDQVSMIEVDLFERGHWINVFTEDRS